jgi:uncharacterized paraquat-inducible protein A
LNKVGYKSLKITATYNGMVGTFVDKDDGQVYEVSVRPLGITINKEDIEKPVFCVECQRVLSDEEKKEGETCNRCYTRLQKEQSEEREHSDERNT